MTKSTSSSSSSSASSASGDHGEYTQEQQEKSAASLAYVARLAVMALFYQYFHLQTYYNGIEVKYRDFEGLVPQDPFPVNFSAPYYGTTQTFNGNATLHLSPYDPNQPFSGALQSLLSIGAEPTLNTLIANLAITSAASVAACQMIFVLPVVVLAINKLGEKIAQKSRELGKAANWYRKQALSDFHFAMLNLSLGWHLPTLLSAYRLSELNFTPTVSVTADLLLDNITPLPTIKAELPALRFGYNKVTSWFWYIFQITWPQAPQETVVCSTTPHPLNISMGGGPAPFPNVFDCPVNGTGILAGEAMLSTLTNSKPGKSYLDIAASLSQTADNFLNGLLANDTLISNAYYLSLQIAPWLLLAIALVPFVNAAIDSCKKKKSSLANQRNGGSDYDATTSGGANQLLLPATADQAAKPACLFDTLEDLLTEQGRGIRKLTLTYVVVAFLYSCLSNYLALIGTLAETNCTTDKSLIGVTGFVFKNLILYMNPSWIKPEDGTCSDSELYFFEGADATNPTTFISTLTLTISMFYLIGASLQLANYIKNGFKHKEDSALVKLYRRLDSALDKPFTASSRWFQRYIVNTTTTRTLFQYTTSMLGMNAVFSFAVAGLAKAYKTGEDNNGVYPTFWQFLFGLFNTCKTDRDIQIKSGFMSNFIFSLYYNSLFFVTAGVTMYLACAIKNKGKRHTLESDVDTGTAGSAPRAAAGGAVFSSETGNIGVSAVPNNDDAMENGDSGYVAPQLLSTHFKGATPYASRLQTASCFMSAALITLAYGLPSTTITKHLESSYGACSVLSLMAGVLSTAQFTLLKFLSAGNEQSEGPNSKMDKALSFSKKALLPTLIALTAGSIAYGANTGAGSSSNTFTFTILASASLAASLTTRYVNPIEKSDMAYAPAVGDF